MEGKFVEETLLNNHASSNFCCHKLQHDQIKTK